MLRPQVPWKKVLSKLEWSAPWKRGNIFDLHELILYPFCLPDTHIDLNICLKFQSNHSSRNVISKRDKCVTGGRKKCDVRTDAGQNKYSLSICHDRSRSRRHKNGLMVIRVIKCFTFAKFWPAIKKHRNRKPNAL